MTARPGGRAGLTALVVGSSLLAAACGAGAGDPADPGGATASRTPGSTGSTSAATPVDRDTGWRSDLATLVTARDEIHADPWIHVSRAAYEAAVDAIAEQVPELSDDQMLVETLRLAAMPTWGGRDGHGGIYPWFEGGYETHMYPLRLFAFADGLFVVDALPPYEDMVGGQLTAISRQPIEDVLAAVGPLAARDNEHGLRTKLPRYLVVAEILAGLGVTETAQRATFTIMVEGSARDVDLKSISSARHEAWAGGHFGLTLPPRPGTPWLSRMHEPVWWQLLVEERVAYVQYNVVTSVPKTLLAEVRTAIDEGAVDRLVVDVRHNGGGDNTTYLGLLLLLEDFAAASPGRLYVMTASVTFSAAGNFVAEVVDRAGAVVVGEAMGGAPSQFGDARTVDLPYSGLVLRVAPRWIQKSAPGDPRLTIEPALPAPLTSVDYFRDRDPAITAVLRTA